MRDEVGAEAVLITGVFGSGKSSVAAELADLLEREGLSYAALDLDWWRGSKPEARRGRRSIK